MIRILAEKLAPGQSPVYSFPSDYPFPVFFMNREGPEKMEPGALRVTIPMFKIRHEEKTSGQEIIRKTRKKVLFYVADVCDTLGFFDECTIAMPLSTQAILPAQIPSDGRLTYAVHLGLMLSKSCPTPGFHTPGNPSWIPDECRDVEHLRFFAENLRLFEVVSDVSSS